MIAFSPMLQLCHSALIGDSPPLYGPPTPNMTRNHLTACFPFNFPLLVSVMQERYLVDATPGADSTRHNQKLTCCCAVKAFRC